MVKAGHDYLHCSETLFSDPLRTSDRIFAAGSAVEIIITKLTLNHGVVNYPIIRKTFKILCMR